MSEASLLRITEQGLMLVLYCAGPALLAAALAGGLADFLQRRAGVEDSALPRFARLAAGLLTALALAPHFAQQLARLATAVWTALPELGR